MPEMEQEPRWVRLTTEAQFRVWVTTQNKEGWRIVSVAKLDQGIWPKEWTMMLVIVERPKVLAVHERHPAGGGPLIPPRSGTEVVKRRRRTEKA